MKFVKASRAGIDTDQTCLWSGLCCKVGDDDDVTCACVGLQIDK
jgi:hypothetical protein